MAHKNPLSLSLARRATGGSKNSCILKFLTVIDWWGKELQTMSETGKEVKAVYIQRQKTVSSEEETMQRHQCISVHAHPQSTMLPSEPSCSQTSSPSSTLCDLQIGPDTYFLPPALHWSTDSESHNESDQTSVSAAVQPHLCVPLKCITGTSSLNLGSCMVCQLLSAFLCTTEAR